MSANVFNSAKWIWNKEAVGTDCYCEFVFDVNSENDGQSLFRVSSDSNYALYINGNFTQSGQYADYPHYKVFDEIDITKSLSKGKNTVCVIVWYYGVKAFTYKIGKPGLIFEIEQNGKIIISSGEDILSRKSRKYISGKNEMITPQLGLNFHIDLTEDNFDGFTSSIICDEMPENFIKRPVKKLNIGNVKKGKIVNQGCFSYIDNAGDFGAKMQHSALEFYRLEDMTEKQTDVYFAKNGRADGIYFILDLMSETTGYLDFDIEVFGDCDMEIGWGEHLDDGRCRTKIGKRNFSVTVKLKKGVNRYMNPFRRFGCRYLQFFIHTNKVKVNHFGLRPVTYPLNVKTYKSGNLLRDNIYKVCENTLIQCMHEHYEDCTWREQSFYTLDSRNQMLCGYYAFGEYDFPKAGLKLFSKAIKEDGLLTICSPTDEKLKIPSFSLFYILQLTEYYKYSGDTETVKFCFDTAKKVIDTFVNRIDGTGLIPNFEGEYYWNFYEWQPGLDGSDKSADRYDTCLSCILSIVLEAFSELCTVVNVDSKSYLDTKKALNRNIYDKFFDKNSGFFKLYLNQEDDRVSVLANAFAILCGAISKDDAENMLELILSNGSSPVKSNVIEASLSMDTFRYEALLKADKEKYKDAILNEIDRVYFNMLRNGATSFWETKKGADDFKYAGSLCHGWSAMPIYYYETLFSKGEQR